MAILEGGWSGGSYVYDSYKEDSPYFLKQQIKSLTKSIGSKNSKIEELTEKIKTLNETIEQLKTKKEYI